MPCVTKAPLTIKDIGSFDPHGQPQNVTITKWKEVLGKGKGLAGSDDSFFSADSDLIPVEGDKMDIDSHYGIQGLSHKEKDRAARKLNAGRPKLKKPTQKILRERANRSKILSKKNIDCVGKFWAKLKISDGKKKTHISPRVGDKLETIEEDSEDWVPVKKRCKFQKCYHGKDKFKFGLSENDCITSSSEDSNGLLGVVAGPNQPPTEI